MDDKLKTLHDNLVKDGYDLPDYETFKSDMQDETKLKKLHENLSKDNYDLPDYETFSSDMGLKKKSENSETTTTPSSSFAEAVGQSVSEAPSIKEQNKKALQVENSNVLKSKMADYFSANPNPIARKAYIDKLGEIGYDKDKLEAFASDLTPLMSQGGGNTPTAIANKEKAQKETIEKAKKLGGETNFVWDIGRKIDDYVFNTEKSAVQGLEQAKKGAQKATDYKSSLGDVATGYANAVAGGLKAGFGVASLVNPELVTFNATTEAVKALPEKAKSSIVKASTPSATGLTDKQASETFDKLVDTPFALATTMASELGYNPKEDSFGKAALEILNLAIPIVAHKIGGGIKTADDLQKAQSKVADGTATPEEVKNLVDVSNELPNVPLGEIKQDAHAIIKETPTHHEELHDKVQTLQQTINSPEFQSQPKDIQDKIVSDYKEATDNLAKINADETLANVEDAKINAEIEHTKSIIRTTDNPIIKEAAQYKLKQLENDSQTKKREVYSEIGKRETPIEEKPIEETGGKTAETGGVLQEQEVKQPTGKDGILSSFASYEGDIPYKLIKDKVKSESDNLRGNPEDIAKVLEDNGIKVTDKPEAKVEPIGKEVPTKKNIQERINTEHPFYKNVLNGLQKLGIIDNGETLPTGVVLEKEGNGFVSGNFHFNGNGEIKFIDSNNIVEFDKDGNVIKSDLANKERTKTDIESDIDNKEKLKQDLINKKNSEDFKYKSTKGGVRRLKTDAELKESHKKIDEAISKLESEINEHKKELESTKKVTEPELKETPLSEKEKENAKPIEDEVPKLNKNKLKFVEEHFDSIVAQLITKNKIKRRC